MNMAANQSGYEVAGEPVPGRTETKTKKFLGIDWAWPNEEIDIPPSTKYSLVPIGKKGKKPLKTATKRKIGDVVSKGGRKYKIVEFDTDGEPLVEEVR